MNEQKILAGSLIALVLATGAGCVALGFRPAAYHPQINPAEFTTTIDNPFYPLVPGTTFKFAEKVANAPITNEVEVTVTHDTRTIMGVKCVVVRDTVTEKGVLTEDTYDWFAQHKDGTVWYFGEAVKEYGVAGKVGTAGSWEAGVNGAQPGIVMPGQPTPGEPMRQGYLRGEEEDMVQIMATDETVKVPFGTYSGCARTKDWSMLESGSEKKWYAKGIGFIRSESVDDEVELVSVTQK